jgi:hypothetical protein
MIESALRCALVAFVVGCSSSESARITSENQNAAGGAAGNAAGGAAGAAGADAKASEETCSEQQDEK